MSNSSENIIFDFVDAIPIKTTLSIDILNKTILKETTKKWYEYPYPSEIQIISNERFRGNLLYKEAMWGFKETTSNAKTYLSNAVVFNNDLVYIKIEPLGHGVGYLPTFPNQLIFCKTTLYITLYDLVNGWHKTLSFNKFEKPTDDVGRYIVWEVPDIDNNAKEIYTQKGYYGLYIIETKEIHKWYLDANWTNPINIEIEGEPQDNPNTSYIQIFVYWWKRFLSEIDISNPTRNISVLKNANFITLPIDLNDGKTAVEVWDEHTSFPSYRYISGGQPVDLNSSEKDAMIKGNAWSMASSQLPLLTSDYKKGKLFGLGIVEPSPPPQIAPLQYVKTNNDVSSSVGTKQIYNLNGIPVAYNLHNFLSDITGDHQQSTSKIYDPLRCLWLNKNNFAAQLGFVVSANDIVGCELINFNTKEKNIYDVIDNNIPRVENITSIVKNYLDSYIIIIEYDIVKGEDKIIKISYGIAVDNYAYNVYIDSTGKTRRVEFKLYEQFKKTITPHSIINIRIGLEDNEGKIYYYYHNHNLATDDSIVKQFNSYSCINNLIAYQRKDGSKIVDIFYDYYANYEISPAEVKLTISSDYGLTFNVPTTSAQGDIGMGVHTGPKRHIIWKPEIDLPNFSGCGIVFNLSIVDGEQHNVAGRTTSGAICIDTTTNKPYILLQKAQQPKYAVYNEEDIKNEGIFSFEEESYVWESASSQSSSSISSSSQLERFVTLWDTTKINGGSSLYNQIKLPLTPDGTYDFYINWGDGSPQEHITSWDQPQTTHTYAKYKKYLVTIHGKIKGWCFNGNGDILKLLEIKQWGNLQLTNTGKYFKGCQNLDITATDILDLSSITDMSYMFWGCQKLKFNSSINNWDVSAIENMEGLFAWTGDFNQDIGRWNVGNVTNMKGIFYTAKKFNQNIGNWDVSKVTNMWAAFAFAYQFNQDLSKWNVGNVTNMCGMFAGADRFNQNISKWDVSNVENMTGMFAWNPAFNQNLGGWNIKNLKYADQMFGPESGLSVVNYDALLIGWSSLPSIQPGVVFGAGNSKYTKPPSAAATARAKLQAPPKNWIITDGGPTP